MAHQENTLELVGKGALAGLVGTAALTAGMMLMPHVLPESGPFDPERDHRKEPNEKLVESVMLALWGTLPSERTETVGGQVAHWGYGATWGAIYALAQSRLQLPPNTHGLMLGALVGTTASTVVPALQLSPPPTREPLPKTLMMTGLQMLFGWVTAQTFDALAPQEHRAHQRQRDYGYDRYNRDRMAARSVANHYGNDPYATQRYPGRPDGEVIERRFEQVHAPMPNDTPSLAEPAPESAPLYAQPR